MDTPLAERACPGLKWVYTARSGVSTRGTWDQGLHIPTGV